jgi:hypothetical protein
MVQITPIDDLLGPRSVVWPVAMIAAAVAVAAAVAAWVAQIDSPSSDVRPPQLQAFFPDARFPNLTLLPPASALDTKLQVAKALLALRLSDPGWNPSDTDESPARIEAAVPLPRPRPASVVQSAQADDRTLLQRLSDVFRPRMTLASMTPQDTISTLAPDHALLGYNGVTAVYDISAKAVFLPNGLRLEAHSGFGNTKDDPRHVSERDVGATPPAVYDLKPRHQPFHGVQALRMIPVKGSTLGRTGLLAHGYMLGPDGDSNGCVSIKDYERFLAAFQRGEIKHLMVVSSLADLPRQPLKS